MQPNIDDIFICLDDKCMDHPKVIINLKGLVKHKQHSV